MTRKLASIQKIIDIIPHNNADSLEIAKVLGWTCIVKKGEFKKEDLIVFCEIDSVLPDKPEFEFLRKSKFRIRTIRLRGVISQGLILPLNILNGLKFPNDTRENPSYEFKENMEVTAMLDIVKYEPPVPEYLQGEVAGNFPTSLLPKSDETRCQCLQPLLTKYKGTKCYVTEKIDGSSLTFIYNENEFFVCSRNLNLKVNDENKEHNHFVKMAVKLDIENKLKSLNRNIAIQGELFGPGIQNNPLEQKEVKVLFFNAWDIDKQEYFSLNEFKNIIAQLGLETVPILEEDYILEDDIDKLINKAKGTSVLNPKVQREGIVIRPVVEILEIELFDVELVRNRVSFKAINPEYLLIFEE